MGKTAKQQKYINDWKRAKYASDPKYREQCKAAARGRDKNKRREGRLKSTFGISTRDYEALLQFQDGACAICRTRKPGGRSKWFHIDHCHTAGQIRGLLCTSCNVGIGHFKDDPENLERAAHYLLGHEDGR